MSADAIVIGGGVMGCAIALRLAQRGARVRVLERSIPGAEASSAAAGILGPQLEAHEPGPLLDLCLRSRALYPAFAAELLELSGLDVAYRPCGALQVAFTESAARTLDATLTWQRGRGLRADRLTGDDARALEPKLSPQALVAAHYPDDHQVDTRLLVRALSMAAARVGVEFVTGYVRGVRVDAGRVVGVDLDGVTMDAPHVVLAAGSWSSLVPGAGIDPLQVRPARGQMLQLQTRLPLFKRIIASDRGYLVPRSDGRLIAGSTMEHAGFEKQVTAGGLAKILGMALELCPSLADAQVQDQWAGLRPDTEDHLPILGPGPLPGLLIATGHFRNGILLTPVTADLIAQLLVEGRTGVDISPFRFDRLSGPPNRM